MRGKQNASCLRNVLPKDARPSQAQNDFPVGALLAAPAVVPPSPFRSSMPGFRSAGVPAGSSPVFPARQMSPWTEPALQSHQQTVGAQHVGDPPRWAAPAVTAAITDRKKRTSTVEGNAVRELTNMARCSWRGLVTKVLA